MTAILCIVCIFAVAFALVLLVSAWDTLFHDYGRDAEHRRFMESIIPPPPRKPAAPKQPAEPTP